MHDTIFWCLLAVVIVFSCLAYGSTTTAVSTIIEIVLGSMVLYWLSDMAYKKKLRFLNTGLAKPALIFLSIIIVQLIPLPFGLVKFISSYNAYLYDNLIPDRASQVFFTLSIYPNATITELLKTLTYVAVFFLIINKIETKRELSLIMNTIIFLGLAISIFGIIQKYTYSGKVYWFDRQGSAGSPFGPFVNRNNFAGYINMVIPLGLGLFMTETSLAKRIIYGFSMVVMSAALFLSLSRAGILVYVLVIMFILILCGFKHSLKVDRKTLYVWASLVVCSFVLFVDIKTVQERLSTLFSRDAWINLGHGYSWLDIINIWRDFPLFGSGLGTFGSISPMYKTTLAQNLFTYAHNDYLQLLSEVGLLGSFFMVVFFIYYFKSILKVWFKRHDRYVSWLAIGGIASVFGMLVYSFLDFNLHIFANALLFFIIMGLTLRLAHTRFDDVVFK